MRGNVWSRCTRRWSTTGAVGGTEAQIRISQIADPFPDDLDETAVPPDEEANHVYGEVLRAAMDNIQHQFEPRTWQAFWLTLVEGNTPAEAGEILKMRPGTVRVSKCRVLARLREELGELLK